MKPGYKTTEFWMTIAQHVLGIIMMVVGLFQANPIAQIVGMIVGGLMNILGTGGYQAARTRTKAPSPFRKEGSITLPPTGLPPVE